MKFYILPEYRDKFEKQVKRASKHLTTAPSVTFSEPMEKERIDVMVWKDEDGVGRKKYKTMITVIEVTIDDITSGDWILVANVFYDEGIVGMCNAKHFKDIPAHFGLDYAKCDYCGHTHHNRNKAHIVYNTVTGEWKQIGTTCGKKMFENGDVCKFIVNLYNVFDISMGCSDDDWGGWCGRIPDHHCQIAYNVDELLAAVTGYRKDVNAEWEKTYWKGEGLNATKVSGTTKKLLDYYQDHSDALVPDMEYNGKVRAYVATLPNDDRYDDLDGLPQNNYMVEGFKSGIKRAFEDGFVLNKDFCKVFFAVKMYEESLTKGDWEKQAAAYTIGEKARLAMAVLVEKWFYNDYYGSGWGAKFKTADGMVFQKSFSNWDGFENKFKNEDGTYSFQARVDYINNNKRVIRLGGPASKIS